jgi:putative endonuclease
MISPVTDPRRRFGNHGEDLAVVFFMQKGFRIIERNWLCRLGEIDLILEKEGVVHFVEVKTRKNLAFGYPEAAITGKKLRHLARAIEVYISRSGFRITKYQADALAIVLGEGIEPQFQYIEHIL